MLTVKLLGNKRLEVGEAPDPKPAPDEVLIQVKASGICGGEMHGFRAEKGSGGNGGHEVAGVVADPNGHPQWAAGDEVVIFTLQGCGKCRWCRQGKDTFCKEVKIPRATHSQYTTSRATAMVKRPADIPFPLAVLLGGDGLGVPMGATWKAGVKPGDVTCVIGCGPVGLGMVMCQAYLGAKVIAVEPNPARRALALKLGAWQTLDPTAVPDPAQALRDMTEGVGPEKVFEASGRQESVDLYMNATAPEGVVVIVGHGKQQLDPQKLIIKRNLTVMGNWICHPALYPRMLSFARSGLEPQRLITGVYPYAQAQTAFERCEAGLEAKAILEW
jgi:threonine dehydrogenase-like Zn-dependent dehydrogenase